jgi:hypothetical protein
MTVSKDRSDSIPFGYWDFGDLFRKNRGSNQPNLEITNDMLGELLSCSKQHA